MYAIYFFNRSIWLLSLTLFILALSTNYAHCVISLYAKEFLLIPHSIVGAVQACVYLGLLLGALLSHKLLKYFSLKNLTIISLIILSGCISLHLFYHGMLYWSIIRTITGLALGILYVCIETWLLTLSLDNYRSQVMSWYMIILSLGHAISPFFISLNENIIQYIFPFISGFLLIAIIPLLFIQNNQNHHLTISSSKSPLPILKIIYPFAFVASFCGVVLGTYYTFIPIFSYQVFHSPGSLMTIFIIGGLLGQIPLSYYADSFNGISVLKFQLILFSFVGLFFIQQVYFWAALGLFIHGFLSFPLYPISLAEAALKAPDAIIDVAVLILFSYSLGAFIGPILIPLLLPLNNYPQTLFMLTSALSLTIIPLLK